MSDELRERLQAVYDDIMGVIPDILDTFIQQFGEENVDSNIITFDGFVNKLNGYTLGRFINSLHDSNDYGSYSIDRGDYEQNGRGKKFLEYIPDLGLISYLTPEFRRMLSVPNNYFVIVHFPQVRVTNEYDKYIDIQDLYARVFIRPDGRLYESFKMARTTFPYVQFKAGYSHSHLPVCEASEMGNWLNPCLGSGPIRTTQQTLARGCNLPIWGLFVYELSNYVTIESTTGGPYIRLESVGKGDVVEGMHTLMYRSLKCPKKHFKKLCDRFAVHYARHNGFKVRYVDGVYKLGESPINAIVRLSNAFIKWYNEEPKSAVWIPSFNVLKSDGMLKEYIVSNNNIYEVVRGSRDVSSALSINGKSLFTFKGETVRLKIITDSNITPENKSLLLNKAYCEYIFSKALAIINYKYGKRKGQQGVAATYPDFPEASEKSYYI